jgi:hypothetical protein
MNDVVIFDFDSNNVINSWQVINDGVMGGKSKSQFYCNDEGQGTFEGKISLENNGGFCSVRYTCNPVSLTKNKSFIIRLKGDKKQYQFRVKSDRINPHSYIFPFQTSGEWQSIIIPIHEMYPAFRGQKLAIPNYDGANLAEIAFLIGNKEAQSFKLLIKSIKVQ